MLEYTSSIFDYIFELVYIKDIQIEYKNLF